MFYTIFICFLAGLGAGLGTGFAGMSAAVVISPMLITFLNVPVYNAISIALASDVLASAVSAYIYGKNGHIDIRNGVIMMISVLCFTFIGSWVSSIVPSTFVGNFSIWMMIIIGLRFLIRPVLTAQRLPIKVTPAIRAAESIISGVVVGFTCGFVGAGGGMMMLFVLTFLLGYELKTAVGTSVFIMTFTALTGAVSHFVIGGLLDLSILIMCIIFTLIFARIAARFANQASPKILNRVTGIVLLSLGGYILLLTYVL